MYKKFGHMNCLSMRLIKRIIFIACFFVISESYAETNKSENLLEQYRQLLSEQEKKFEAQRQILNQQGKELEQLRKNIDTLSNQAPGAAEKASSPSQTTTSAANKDETGKTPDQPPSGPVGQAPPKPKEPERPPEMPRLTETVGGVLTRKGNIVVEPALSYSFAGNNRVFVDAFTFLPAITIGLTDIRQVKRHSIFASLGLRYGVTSRLEVEARVPYVYRADIQRARPFNIGVANDQVFNADGSDIGDLEFTARYQLSNGSGGWPILVGNMLTTVPTGKSPFDLKFEETSIEGTPFRFPIEVPTGTGFFTFQPSLTALYPTAPAVFFGNLNYTYTMSTNENIGKVDAGDAVGMTFGMGFSVNNRTSFNLGYSHRHFFNTKIDGDKIGGSALDIGQLLLGYSFRYSKQTNYNLSVGVGTTDNAQDVSLNFRMPMNFSIF